MIKPKKLLLLCSNEMLSYLIELKHLYFTVVNLKYFDLACLYKLKLYLNLFLFSVSINHDPKE